MYVAGYRLRPKTRNNRKALLNPGVEAGIPKALNQRSPTPRLIGGLVLTLLAVGMYSGYTVVQLRSLRRIQTEIIDRNRADSLLLLRIQNGLDNVALAMRDMLDSGEPYPLTAWQSQLRRLRGDLEDALAREEKYSVGGSTPVQRRYLADSFRQFWDAVDRVFDMAANGQEKEARLRVRESLQARQEALSAAVARLLVRNNASETQAAAQTQELYARVERNVYLLLAAMLIFIALTGLYIAHSNRRLFQQAAELSERRSELAQQLISMQESTFRSISRELHDDFGQILTALGAMLQRATRRAPQIAGDLAEVQQIVQTTLEKVRALSHALHPVVLDEAGLESALDVYLPAFERQNGIAIRYEKTGASRELDRELSIHLYRVMQEALTNVARHAGTNSAAVRLLFQPDRVTLEVEDDGAGFGPKHGRGMGLVSMRERAEMVNGSIEFLSGRNGGALVRVTAPLTREEAHAES
jgi:signal transduction histidine kinase